jgi:hypothetical protein
LEVTTRGLSIGDLRTVSGLAPTAAAGETSNIENIEPLLVIFAKSLVSWNYEDEDGEPVGTSLEELRGQDMRMLMPVVMTWISEVSTIPDPLPKPSTDGETTEPVGSIPMEILPANP